MDYEKQTLEKLASELVELWVDCKTRCERIETLGRQLFELKESK